MKIWQKGVVLVCLPLLFELVFTGALYVVLSRAQDQILCLENSRWVIQSSADLMCDIIDVMTAALAYRVTGNSSDKSDFVVAWQQTYRKRNLLVAQLSSREGILRFEKALPAINRNMLVCRDFIMSDQPEGYAGLGEFRQKTIVMMGMLGRSEKAIDEFLSPYLQAEKESPEKRRTSAEWIQFVVIAGIFLNVILTLYLAVFFGTEITFRLKTLIENTIRFGNSQPLAPALKGIDELSQFDRTFRDSIRTIEETESFKRQLVSVVSHELRTPLTSIDAIVALLSAGAMGELPAGLKESLKEVEQNIAGVMRLINDLLDVEKMEAGKFPLEFRKFEVRQLLQSVADETAAQESQRMVDLLVGESDLSIEGDLRSLSKALCRLTLYAIRRSSARVAIRLSTEDVGQDVLISVEDNCSTMSTDEQKELFDKLHLLRAGGEQESEDILGLALCKAIVVQHGGSVGVESGIDASTTRYWLRLPRTRSKTGLAEVF
jgi:signal transduction histidine kinase